MRKQECDCLLVTDPIDVAYLTGFHGGDSWLVVPARGKPTLVSDFRYVEELEPFKPLVSIHMRDGAMPPAAGGIVRDLKPDRCAVQAEHLTLAVRSKLAKVIGAKRLHETDGLVSTLRMVKDEGEIAILRKAIRIQEDALKATLPTIEAGQTELEVCARLEYEMMIRGASGPSFGTIVGAKANSSLPHYRPAKAKVGRNHVVLIDWGAEYAGYHGDTTRVFALGRWPAKVAEIYEIVLEAYERAVASLRAGVFARDVDAAARDHIAACGYGDKFGHGLGHGIGLRIHEGPSLGRHAGEARLEAGHVVTIEPGVYLPGIGGVRIEDDYLVTERGSRRLGALPRTREWATLD